MALSDDDAARLADLRTARDKLLKGTQAVRTRDASGREVEYVKADIALLREEIASLEAQSTTSGRKRGAIRFTVR